MGAVCKVKTTVRGACERALKRRCRLCSRRKVLLNASNLVFCPLAFQHFSGELFKSSSPHLGARAICRQNDSVKINALPSQKSLL